MCIAQALISQDKIADGTMLPSDCDDDAEFDLESIFSVTSCFGLTLSILNTKLLVMGDDIEATDTADISVNGNTVNCVNSFKYIGSVFSSDCRSTTWSSLLSVKLVKDT